LDLKRSRRKHRWVSVRLVIFEFDISLIIHNFIPLDNSWAVLATREDWVSAGSPEGNNIRLEIKENHKRGKNSRVSRIKVTGAYDSFVKVRSWPDSHALAAEFMISEILTTGSALVSEGVSELPSPHYKTHPGCAASRSLQHGNTTCKCCGGRFKTCTGSYGHRNNNGTGTWSSGPCPADPSHSPESPNTTWCTAECERLDGGASSGCSSSCSLTHSNDGNCLICGKGWGSHNGHNCSSGARGSWRVVSATGASNVATASATDVANTIPTRIQNLSGRSPLHYAVTLPRGLEVLTSKLLEFDPECVNLKDSRNRLPLEYALCNTEDQSIDILCTLVRLSPAMSFQYLFSVLSRCLVNGGSSDKEGVENFPATLKIGDIVTRGPHWRYENQV